MDERTKKNDTKLDFLQRSGSALSLFRWGSTFSLFRKGLKEGEGAVSYFLIWSRFEMLIGQNLNMIPLKNKQGQGGAYCDWKRFSVYPALRFALSASTGFSLAGTIPQTPPPFVQYMVLDGPEQTEWVSVTLRASAAKPSPLPYLPPLPPITEKENMAAPTGPWVNMASILQWSQQLLFQSQENLSAALVWITGQYRLYSLSRSLFISSHSLSPSLYLCALIVAHMQHPQRTECTRTHSNK